MVAGIDLDTHFLQYRNHLATKRDGKICREVKVATFVMWEGDRFVVFNAQ